MARAADVAQYILENAPQGEMSTIKLQKLVYYCQAWCLAWTGKPLYEDDIQAWAAGPVVPSLYELHRNQLNISKKQNIGDASSLTAKDIELINDVLPTYIDKEPVWLVGLTHLEEPWKIARGSCLPGERCTNTISHASMAEYYTSIMS